MQEGAWWRCSHFGRHVRRTRHKAVVGKVRGVQSHEVDGRESLLHQPQSGADVLECIRDAGIVRPKEVIEPEQAGESFRIHQAEGFRQRARGDAAFVGIEERSSVPGCALGHHGLVQDSDGERSTLPGQHRGVRHPHACVELARHPGHGYTVRFTPVGTPSRRCVAHASGLGTRSSPADGRSSRHSCGQRPRPLPAEEVVRGGDRVVSRADRGDTRGAYSGVLLEEDADGTKVRPFRAPRHGHRGLHNRLRGGRVFADDRSVVQPSGPLALTHRFHGREFEVAQLCSGGIRIDLPPVAVATGLHHGSGVEQGQRVAILQQLVQAAGCCGVPRDRAGRVAGQRTSFSPPLRMLLGQEAIPHRAPEEGGGFGCPGVR